MAELRFLVYLIDLPKNKRSFKGWLRVTVNEAFLEEELIKLKEEFIKNGRNIIMKHFSDQERYDIAFISEIDVHSDLLLYEYEVRGHRIQVLYRYVGRIEYIISKIFPFLYALF